MNDIIKFLNNFAVWVSMFVSTFYPVCRTIYNWAVERKRKRLSDRFVGNYVECVQVDYVSF